MRGSVTKESWRVVGALDSESGFVGLMLHSVFYHDACLLDRCCECAVCGQVNKAKKQTMLMRLESKTDIENIYYYWCTLCKIKCT